MIVLQMIKNGVYFIKDVYENKAILLGVKEDTICLGVYGCSKTVYADEIDWDKLAMDFYNKIERHTYQGDGAPIELSPIELLLLVSFYENCGSVIYTGGNSNFGLTE